MRIDTSNDQRRKLAMSAGAVTELEVRTLEWEVVQLVNVVRDIATSDDQQGELRMVME